MSRFLRGKYGNKRCKGYASKREAARAAELQLLEKMNEIRNLEFQVKYELIPKQDGERACHYIADFRYVTKDGVTIVEDAKGFKTPDYVIKRKLMQRVHGIKVLEV